jgi:hypothetical protein
VPRAQRKARWRPVSRLPSLGGGGSTCLCAHAGGESAAQTAARDARIVKRPCAGGAHAARDVLPQRAALRTRGGPSSGGFDAFCLWELGVGGGGVTRLLQPGTSARRLLYRKHQTLFCRLPKFETDKPLGL